MRIFVTEPVNDLPVATFWSSFLRNMIPLAGESSNSALVARELSITADSWNVLIQCLSIIGTKTPVPNGDIDSFNPAVVGQET